MNAHILAALRMLSKSEFCSGEDIASRLGVTRATVWNALQAAQSLGLEIEKVRGQGYRLLHPPVWLDEKRIAKGVAARLGRALPIVVLDDVTSTNTHLLRQASDNAPSGTVAVAELQTAGKGRRGRAWSTGLGGALTFSLLWRFDQSVAALSGLSLAVGLAVATALKDLGADAVGVKWPNDIVVSDKKLGGILIELQGDALGPTAAVIGIGINVRLSKSIRERIDQPATDLVSLQPIEDRNDIMVAMLTHLVVTLERFAHDGFAAMENEYRKLHVLQDKEVTVHMSDGEQVHGKVAGTASDGALLLETDGNTVRFHGGEVSVRKHAARMGTTRA